MPNKTISLPDDVLPVIESLEVPFSQWVAEQLRRHAAQTASPFGDQLLADAALAGDDPPRNKEAIGQHLQRSAPW